MSMNSKKKRDERKKKEKKGLVKPSSDKLRRTISKNHMDLLQNIEFVLVRHYRDNDDIDDNMCADALRSVVKDKPLTNPYSISMAEELLSLKASRGDVDDKLWIDSCRVVLNSINDHSTLAPGNRGYLTFMKQFVR